MNVFEKMVAADHKNILLNTNELGQTHNLNGTDCICSVQALTDKDKLVSQGVDFDSISGEMLNVFATLEDVKEQPQKGQLFLLDTKPYFVHEVVNNYDMLKITLGANKP